MKRIFLFLLILSAALCSPSFAAAAAEKGSSKPISAQYQEYENRLNSIKKREDITAWGFRIIENQVFPLKVQAWGEVTFIPALDQIYNRFIICLADKNGTIVFKTDQLETNNRNKGMLEQPNTSLSAVSFQNLNDDLLTDIILITACINEEGHTYKVGDVLFQNEKGFYRDWRLSDKLNRFSMNKSILFITSFVKKGYSTEFLYTSTTKDELLDHGFSVSEWQGGTIRFEKMGSLLLLAGTYRMAEHTIYMVYLINEQGYIVWSFQPMGDYENLCVPLGIVCRDIDGDGMKDIVILADYSYEGTDGVMIMKREYSIYYQRTGGFLEDSAYKKENPCSSSDTLEDVVRKARKYWGTE